MTLDPVSGDCIEAVAAIAPDFLGGQKLEDGIGLCLSGGGFRAMLFHLGALFRLNELGLLGKLDRVASVSGGSIAAGLAVAWHDLNFDDAGVATNLPELVAKPLLTLARMRVDVPAIALGFLPLVHASSIASWVYDKVLFHGKTLQDLPASPRFSFTAPPAYKVARCGDSRGITPPIGGSACGQRQISELHWPSAPQRLSPHICRPPTLTCRSARYQICPAPIYFVSHTPAGFV